MKLPTLEHTYYVLRAKGGCEHLAEEELLKAGHFAYLPRYKAIRRVGKNRLMRLIERPLIPGYVFLGTGRGATVAWGDFRDKESYPHVGRVLRGSQGPLRVSSQVVVDIHIQEVEGLYDDKMPKSRDRRRDRIRDLKDLFRAMEAAKMDIAA